MTIYLVNPSYSYPVEREKGLIFNRIWPPLSLLNAGAMAEREGIDVEIIDGNAARLSPKKIAQKIENPEKVFITTSPLDRWQCPHLSIRPVIDSVKEINKLHDTETYLLGVHPTIFPEKFLKELDVDGVIRGEPEKQILEIAKGKSLKEISDLFILKGEEELYFTGKGDPIDLDDLPFPAYHLINLEKYRYEVLGERFALLEASRGCPYSCIFCLKEMYNGYRCKSSEKVKKEIKKLVEDFQVRNIYFFDLEFALNKELVREVSEYIIEQGYELNWTCQTRLDSLNENLLKLMKESGCKLIHFGVESGSERTLRNTGKEISKDVIRNKIEVIHEVGINTVGFFMFGLPNETKEEMLETIEFAKEIDPTYASFHIATPYPGTDFYESSVDGNTFFPETSDEFSKKYLKKIVNKAYKEFYFRPQTVTRLFKMGSPLKKIRIFLNFLQ